MRQRKETDKTLVVGVGEVGEPLAEVLERRMPVLRLDLEPCDLADQIDVMHIWFPFHNSAQFTAAVVDLIRRFDPQLTIINSTVAPGTTVAVARAAGRPICYRPVRGKHAEMAKALLHYVKFVAGTEARAVDAAVEHFNAAGMKIRRVSTPDTLELAKLAETTYFGLCIAFAQELKRYVQVTGASYDEAVRFFEEVEFLPRQTYFPGIIGGHCVIPNIGLLIGVARSPLLEAVLDSNRRRTEEIAAEQPPSRGDGADEP